jgi:predicted lipoprotein with Yx(FWY)xxD motif
MRSTLKFFLPALAASLALAACGGSSSSSSTQASTSTPATTAASAPAGGATAAIVKSASNSALHATVLVNSQGMTLYHLSGEQGGKLICTSAACVATWPPLITSAATPTGSVAGLGTVKRPDGTLQVTYNGEPLYTFAHDRAGEANGQGIKDVGTWTAVTSAAGGAAATPAAAAPPAESSSENSSSGGGGGYSY